MSDDMSYEFEYTNTILCACLSHISFKIDKYIYAMHTTHKHITEKQITKRAESDRKRY